MSKSPILILGAKSDIAKATAHRFAISGHPIQLAARKADDLAADAADIQLRYNVSVSIHEFDALATDSHDRFVRELPEQPMGVVCAVGLMKDQSECEQNIDTALLVFRTNYEGPASILSVLANRFEERGYGTIIGISSVAGERGRGSNYIYGSAKAGFTAFLSGLRARLSSSGVHVITVKPGYVRTKMTDGLDLSPILTASPEEVASRIYNSFRKKRSVLYVRAVWFHILIIIKLLPEFLFKRLKI